MNIPEYRVIVRLQELINSILRADAPIIHKHKDWLTVYQQKLVSIGTAWQEDLRLMWIVGNLLGYFFGKMRRSKGNLLIVDSPDSLN